MIGRFIEEQILNDMEGSGSSLILRCYPGICLEGLMKTTKNFRQNSGSPGQEPGMSRTRSRIANHVTATDRVMSYGIPVLYA
jgi:hypothetical protein